MMDVPDQVPTPPPSPVTAWNILWAFLTLSLSCITHPLGSSCGFPPSYRGYARSSPVMALYDSMHLIFKVIQLRWKHSVGVLEAIGLVSTSRLLQPSNSNDSSDLGFDSKSLGIFAGIGARSLISVVCILQYVKLCGYKGVPVPFSICTVMFISWLIMEVFFFITYFCGRHDRSSVGYPEILRPPPLTDAPVLWAQFLAINFILYISGLYMALTNKPPTECPDNTIPEKCPDTEPRATPISLYIHIVSLLTFGSYLGIPKMGDAWPVDWPRDSFAKVVGQRILALSLWVFSGFLFVQIFQEEGTVKAAWTERLP